MKLHFSEQDHQKVKEAVASAEQRTSGEIVPFVVDRSDSYEVAFWRAAVVLGLGALAVALVFVRFYEGWGFGWLHTNWGLTLVTVASATIGVVLVALIPSVRRLAAGDALLTRTVHLRAMRAFLEEEVFKTRDRTGILLFVSILEHRIEVLGDEGINKAVDPQDWVDVVQTIRNGIRAGRLTDGLVEAIEKCGRLLETHGVHIRADDSDELENRLRLGSDE